MLRAILLVCTKGTEVKHEALILNELGHVVLHLFQLPSLLLGRGVADSVKHCVCHLHGRKAGCTSICNTGAVHEGRGVLPNQIGLQSFAHLAPRSQVLPAEGHLAGEAEL